MATGVETLRKKCEKLLPLLKLNTVDSALVSARISEELAMIESRKIAGLFDGKADPRVSVDEAIANQDLSMVGALTGSLRRAEIPPKSISGLEDFLERNDYLRRAKQGALNDKQIRELIYAGAFGSSRQRMVRYCELTKAEFEEVDFAKEQALRLAQIRQIDVQHLSKTIGRPITKFMDFAHPLNHGISMVVVGQLMEEPRRIKTRTGKDMAFMNLYPLELGIEYDSPKYRIIIWPDGFKHLRSLDPAPTQGDLILAAGRRDCDRDNNPQLTIGERDSLTLVVSQ